MNFTARMTFGEEGGINMKYAWIEFGFFRYRFPTSGVKEIMCIYMM